MTKLTRFLVILAIVGLSAGTALGQTKTVLHTVPYHIDRDLSPDAWGTPGPPEDNNNWNCNSGGYTHLRIKAYQYAYCGDWDTAAMQLDVDPGGQLVTGWGVYTPIYSLSVTPATGGTWPVAPVPVHISCVWSENDWVESTGTSWDNYNWPALTYAATYLYAEDIEGLNPFPWIFPGNGPYPRDEDCAFFGTFYTHGDVRDDWQPWNGEVKTPTNSTDIVGSLADEGNYLTVDLDQAIIDDMLTNEYNRGLTLWNMDDWSNKNIYSRNQNQTVYPYIHGRIEAWSGDGNLDGCVDGLDYVIWSNNYDLDPSTWPEGDYNLDGITDGLDYVVWSNNYEAGCPVPPGAVPEPATMALLAMGALALLKRRRQ